MEHGPPFWSPAAALTGYIDAGEDVRDNGISAEIATANNPDAGTNGQLTGDTSSAACFFDSSTAVPRAPTPATAATPASSSSPRATATERPPAGDRYPFYAFVTG